MPTCSSEPFGNESSRTRTTRQRAFSRPFTQVLFLRRKRFPFGRGRRRFPRRPPRETRLERGEMRSLRYARRRWPFRRLNTHVFETAIEWILLATLPIDTLEDVLKVIEYYECRWMIEIFFKTLKSGCKVESLQFEETSRLEPCLGVYLIVTWRVLLLCRLGRSHPDWSCEILFDESEWKSTYRVMHLEKALPRKPPSLNVMIRLIGELGGWVSRPGKGEMPGPQTTWIGLQRVHDFARAWNIFGPGAKKAQKDV